VNLAAVNLALEAVVVCPEYLAAVNLAAVNLALEAVVVCPVNLAAVNLALEAVVVCPEYLAAVNLAAVNLALEAVVVCPVYLAAVNLAAVNLALEAVVVFPAVLEAALGVQAAMPVVWVEYQERGRQEVTGTAQEVAVRHQPQVKVNVLLSVTTSGIHYFTHDAEMQVLIKEIVENGRRKGV